MNLQGHRISLFPDTELLFENLREVCLFSVGLKEVPNGLALSTASRRVDLRNNDSLGIMAVLFDGVFDGSFDNFRGRIETKDKRICTGHFVKGMLTGEGTVDVPGRRFEQGTWVDGLLHGRGVVKEVTDTGRLNYQL
ncbi:MAG: hypothetical protein EOP51_20580, partial [Sphingobacteriales bacterium]